MLEENKKGDVRELASEYKKKLELIQRELDELNAEKSKVKSYHLELQEQAERKAQREKEIINNQRNSLINNNIKENYFSKKEIKEEKENERHKVYTDNNRFEENDVRIVLNV